MSTQQKQSTATKAQKHGRANAQGRMADEPNAFWEELRIASSESPDSRLINTIGFRETAKLFGVSDVDNNGFIVACEQYSQAYRETIWAGVRTSFFVTSREPLTVSGSDFGSETDASVTQSNVKIEHDSGPAYRTVIDVVGLVDAVSAWLYDNNTVVEYTQVLK